MRIISVSVVSVPLSSAQPRTIIVSPVSSLHKEKNIKKKHFIREAVHAPFEDI
jgi:hypothetical protein